MGFLANLQRSGELHPIANVAKLANVAPDIRDLRNIRNPPDSSASTRDRLIRAAQAQGIDVDLVLAHLDPEDIEGYVGCHERFLEAAVRAVKSAADRGTCSCNRCKAGRRATRAS
jgi:hypothetical protein